MEQVLSYKKDKLQKSNNVGGDKNKYETNYRRIRYII